MKILKTKKYSILSNVLKYSFVLVFVFSIALSSLLFNNFTKITNAAGPNLSVPYVSHNNATFFISGLPTSELTRYGIRVESEEGEVKHLSTDIDIVDIIDGNTIIYYKYLLSGTKYFAYIQDYFKMIDYQPVYFSTLSGPEPPETPHTYSGAISVASTTSNSVTLTVTEISPEGVYSIDILDSLNTIKSNAYISIPGSDTTTVTSVADKPLTPGTYTAKLFYGGETYIATSSPFTIAPANTATPAISVTGTTSNSATFSVSGLTVGQSYRLNIYTASDVLQSGWDLSRVTSTTVTTETQSQRPLSPGTYVAKLADSTPKIVATSSPFTITAPQAQIISMSPTSGKVGDIITVLGKNFVGVSAVYFGTTKAVTITNTLTDVTVRVPVGATTGKIKIETAKNGNVISAGNFTVTNISTTGTCANGATDYPTCTPPSGSVGSFKSSGDVKFNGLVPVCNTKVDSQTGGFSDPCDFNMVMNIINKLITFTLVTIATPLFALILIYVGWIYLSSGGSSEKVTKAKNIFKNVIIGYIIALAAFLIVKTIMKTIGFTGETFLN